MSGNQILVIGISGATCSGKTTLTRLLSQCFNAKKFNQDDFYFPEDYPGHVKVPGFTHFNWELETAFDNKKLSKAVESAKLITHQIRSEPNQQRAEISSLARALDSPATLQSLITSKAELSPFGAQLFESVSLKAPLLLLVEGITLFENEALFSICDLRLFLTLDQASCWERRNQRTYNPPDPPGYFATTVWPSYEANLDSLKKKSCIHYIDGREPLEANFITAAKLILDCLLKHLSS